MKILIIYAHPEPKSFNNALKEKAKEVLEGNKHEVQISDLYAMKWKAVADKADFTELKDPSFFKMQMEQKEEKMTEDIKAEQKKVEWADMIIFQFPLWWFSCPAILKGWFDRVFSTPWSYSWPKIYDQGSFSKKKALISVTTGGPQPMYQERGLNGNLSKILYPIMHGALYFCGFQVLQPSYWFSPAHSDEARKMYLSQWEERLKNIEKEEPIKFHKMEEYGQTGLPEDKENDFEILGKTN
ncbi:nad p h oxidoreductase-related [Anaeramoeba ignava]|uniref:Nad p h oxidoreductase-related n=1 Tax=Anaeramoeba ignava TaxID=1746090 RepID=A0A9Q0LMX1_ANAIG|nr:nad p h oxidoreductase-related [Anaeramoeba ignava]|eukprot:Anaeramoba_ignava/a217996_312.p1 GENE.a217996_312~~a217996_312.p1  ORF type:complete len:241 (-),score=60.24 a217996_312:47-769(-)